MATLIVRHTVSDYASLRNVYDEFDATRRVKGVTSHGIYQLDANPNDVTVYHEFDTMEAAKAFAGSQELREAMQRTGVLARRLAND
jgi:quinol monooxygenase YgiN